MVIPVSINRPTASQTLPVVNNLDADTNVTVTSNYIELRVFLDNLTIDNTVIAATTDISWVGTTITSVNNDEFAAVRPGDVVSSTTGFVSSQIVSAVSVDGTTITLATAADVDTNNEELTFTPGDIDSTVYFVRLAHNTSGSNLIITPSISTLSGTQVQDGAVDDGSDAEVVTYADGSVKTFPTASVNLDTFYTNARIARTDP